MQALLGQPCCDQFSDFPERQAPLPAIQPFCRPWIGTDNVLASGDSTWTNCRHSNKCQTSCSLPTPVVNDKGRYHSHLLLALRCDLSLRSGSGKLDRISSSG